MKYVLLFLISISLMACTHDHDDEPYYYYDHPKISTWIDSYRHADLTIDVYIGNNDGYITYDTYYTHTTDYMIYYFTYKLQLIDERGYIILESETLTSDGPRVYNKYQGLSIPVGRYYPYPAVRVVILNYTAYNSQSVAN